MTIVDHVVDWVREKLFDVAVTSYVALRRDQEGPRFLDLDGWRVGLVVGDETAYLLASPMGATDGPSARLGEIVGAVAARIGASTFPRRVSVDNSHCFVWSLRDNEDGPPDEVVEFVRRTMTENRACVHLGNGRGAHGRLQ